MDRLQTSAAAGWEYMVIHLNVESGTSPATPGPAKPEGGGSADDGAATARPVFSESFLKKEFPQFYEGRQAAGHPGQPQHPAQQLQNFLNGHGARGWELIGLFPVGMLTMLFFRRPLPAGHPAEALSRASSEQTDRGRGSAEPPAPPQGAAGGGDRDRDAVLEAILARLTALEQGSATAPAAPEASRPRPRSSPPPPEHQDGQRLGADAAETVSDSLLQRLSTETPMPSAAAAQAIGLRSAASLANLGARLGFRRGLCKRGPNGQVAVYVGSGASDHGGKARRLWIVVPAERLQG